MSVSEFAGEGCGYFHVSRHPVSNSANEGDNRKKRKRRRRNKGWQ